MKIFNICLLIVCVLTIFAGMFPRQSQAQTLYLPVKVYLYSFESEPRLNASMDRKEIQDLMEEANRAWSAADIQWNLLSIVDRKIDEHTFPSLTGKEQRPEIRKLLLAASPDEVTGHIWKFVIIKQFPVPGAGVYLPETRTIYFAQQSARGNTHPVIMAHELGHSLGLPHHPGDKNLMRAESRGTPHDEAVSLSREQIETARAQAWKGPIGMNVYPDGSNQQIEPQDQVRTHADQPQLNPSQRQRMAAQMKKFDLNNDGNINYKDVPIAARRAFHLMDRNNDGKVDRHELKDFLKN